MTEIEVNLQLTDASVTELTVGSAFFQSQIFDYHWERMDTQAALVFGLAISRIPEPGIYSAAHNCSLLLGIYTMQSGGFIASGFPSPLSNPTFLDESCSCLNSEGFGEGIFWIEYFSYL